MQDTAAPTDTADLIRESDAHHMGTYLRTPIVIERGEGAYLWDTDGKRYLDFLSGIAVANLGQCDPAVVAALVDQAHRLWHVSNLFYTVPQTRLAAWLTSHSFADRVFFSNSGAEANEAALKLARKRSNDRFGPGRTQVLTTHNSFHGRTFATLAATGQEKVHAGFDPLMPGYVHVRFGDLDAAAAAVDERTCAILVEPIQGEGGVVLPPDGYLAGLRALADEHELTLIYDEVQVGIGRTGHLFAYERFGVAPDVMTLAKALGSGLPIGAMLATEEVARHFGPGAHGSTFGGGPLASAAALATLEQLEQRDLLAHVRAMEGVLRAGLEGLATEHRIIREVRGAGLMFGVALHGEGAPIVAACRERGLILNCVQGTILRLVPPLIVGDDEIREMLSILGDVLASLASGR